MKNIIFLIMISIISGFVSCSQENELITPINNNRYLQAEFTIENYNPGQTRSLVLDQDRWSFYYFTESDQIGLYSYYGNSNSEDGDGSFINAYLTYSRSNGNTFYFKNNQLGMNPTGMMTGGRLMYYPYYVDMPDPYTLTIPDSNGKIGMPLRILNEGIEKCVDLMTIAPTLNNQTGYLNGQFTHMFSEMIITRGKGFNNPIRKDGGDPYEIKVVLTKPFSHVRIVPVANASTGIVSSWRPALMYNYTDSKEDVQKYCEWHAWEGEKYNTDRAWYVVLPTLPTQTQGTAYVEDGITKIPAAPANNPSVVSYVELYDNNGKKHHVTNFYFGSAPGGGNGTYYTHKSLTPSTQYPLMIELIEKEAIIRPYDIQEWKDPEDITDVREVGIGDESEFNSWMEKYNSYITMDKPDDTDIISILQKYGTAVEKNGRYYWSFYITDDITFTDPSSIKISKLDDEIICSSKYRNYELSGLRQTFIEEITTNGSIANIDFRDLYISSISPNPVGGIANTVSGGSILNCSVHSGTVAGNGPAGILVGSLKGGTVSGCWASGLVAGSSIESGYDGLFGEVSGSPVTENNITTGLVSQIK